MTTSTVQKELLGLERQFWDAIKNQDTKTASRLTDDSCVIVGAQGASQVNRQSMAGMMQSANYKLDRFNLNEADAHVQTIGKDVAIIAYKATEDLTVDGKPTKLEAYDSSVWVRKGDNWVCALHTESIAGDPFGRDRRSMI